MAKTSHQEKKNFHWSTKVSNEDEEKEEEAPASFNPCPQKNNQETELPSPLITRTKKLHQNAYKLRSALLKTLLLYKNNRPNSSLLHGLGPRVVGTLFGSRKGHVHFAFQRNPTAQPAFLIELQTPISGLVNEMASGLVRIALECDKQLEDDDKMIKSKGGTNSSSSSSRSRRMILEEPVWRTCCNGKKCGFGMKKECGEKEWKVLKAVEPISMGAGVLPAEKQAGDHNNENNEDGGGDEIMYMRAKFERVVGSRDSEAFYMMNPDSNGAPELSIYLLRL